VYADGAAQEVDVTQLQRGGLTVMYRESDVLAWLDQAFKDEARLSRGRSAETAKRSA
jgi:hypothetical protein